MENWSNRVVKWRNAEVLLLRRDAGTQNYSEWVRIILEDKAADRD
jgi:hypothetical protein